MEVFDVNKKHWELWMHDACGEGDGAPWPLTILVDRYGGTYSGGLYVAFPYEYSDIDMDVSGSDIQCHEFWRSYKEQGGLYGIGASAQDAYDDLVSRIEKYMNKS